jgi:parallel beta-helix repeat protein
MERDASTTTDIAEDMTYGNGGAAWALGNGGEQLILSHASGTIDMTAGTAACSPWCGGDASSYLTMERVSPSADGTSSSNWTSYQSFLGRGHNADGLAIQGTPGRRNSANYLIPSIPAGGSLTLSSSQSPYIIVSGYTVSSGTTLSLDPGVIIKFYNTGSSLTVDGSINTEGTSGSPVVFTSLRDDDCGITGGCGDTNDDGVSTSPAMGDWLGITVSSSASSATFSHAILRWGGETGGGGTYGANLRIRNNNTAITNTVSEYSKLYGIRMDGAGSGVTLSSSSLRHNNRNVPGQSTGAGLYLDDSDPLVSGNTFTDNVTGAILTSSSAPTLTSDTFTSNTGNALESTASYPSSSGSTISGNGGNGIAGQIAIEHDYTLPSDMVFIMQGENSVSAGATLTIPAGAVIKADTGARMTVNGTLNTQGTSGSPVVFTSLRDDDCGITGGCWDTNADATSTTPSPGNWKNIIFTQNLATSTLEYTVVRYGGASSAGFGAGDTGGIRMSGASIAFLHSVLEYNASEGMRMERSTSTVISDSVIRHHHAVSGSPTGYGLFLSSGSLPSITNTLFEDNDTHLIADGTSGYVNGGGNVPGSL